MKPEHEKLFGEVLAKGTVAAMFILGAAAAHLRADQMTEQNPSAVVTPSGTTAGEAVDDLEFTSKGLAIVGGLATGATGVAAIRATRQSRRL